ncbi:MAG: hypothetical protein V4597_18425 [Pseudomonadota bacterium]
MTIMNWRLEPGRAMILSDSLVTDGATGAPAYIAPKVLVLAHLLTLISAKGAMKPAQDLWVRHMSGEPARTIEDLAQVAPGILQTAYAQVRDRLGEDECTVFAFGWSWAQCRVVGYAFGWENGFTAQPLADGEALIPPPASPLPGSADWAATVFAQQSADRGLSPGDRDNIGGILTAHHIVADPDRGAKVLIEHLGPLPHYAEDVAALPVHPAPPARRFGDRSEWIRCEDWLAAALETDSGERTMKELSRGYRSGRYTLFAGQRSALLAEVMGIDDAAHAHLYLAGGELAEIRDVLRPRFESWGQRRGCISALITGRKGWARAFRTAGYELVRPIDVGRNWWLIAKAI